MNMMKEPLKLEVVWEELELPEAEERLSAAFEMLLAADAREGSVQNPDLDGNAVAGNDQIVDPHTQSMNQI